MYRYSHATTTGVLHILIRTLCLYQVPCGPSLKPVHLPRHTTTHCHPFTFAGDLSFLSPHPHATFSSLCLVNQYFIVIYILGGALVSSTLLSTRLSFPRLLASLPARTSPTYAVLSWSSAYPARSPQNHPVSAEFTTISCYHSPTLLLR